MTGILSHIFPSFALYHPAKKVYENTSNVTAITYRPNNLPNPVASLGTLCYTMGKSKG